MPDNRSWGQKTAKEKLSIILLGVFLVGTLVLVFGLPFVLPKQIKSWIPLAIWGGVAALSLCLLIGLGLRGDPEKGKPGIWFGVLVEKDRNRTSLSRLQITLWTVLVISAFLSIALVRTLRPVAIEADPEVVAACKIDYVATQYGLKIGDVTTPQEETPPTDEQATLEQALKEAEEECVPQPLKIRFPSELLAVLGISTASFAGSTLIKINKRGKDSPEIKRLEKEVEETEQDLKEKTKETDRKESDLATVQKVLEDKKATLEGAQEEDEKLAAQGQVENAALLVEASEKMYEAASKEQAKAQEELDKAKGQLAKKEGQGLLHVADEPRLTDIFYGEEEGDHSFIDLGKVQMFFFTIALLVAYAVAIGDLLQNVSQLMNPLSVDLPMFSSSMTTLLGISHAGYLTVKAPDRKGTQPGTQEQV